MDDVVFDIFSGSLVAFITGRFELPTFNKQGNYLTHWDLIHNLVRWDTLDSWDTLPSSPVWKLNNF